MSLAYLSGYKKISKNQTIGGSLRYFTLGNITFTDEVGTQIRDFKPNEFSLDMSFGQKFGDNLSGGIAIRYIYSNLTGGQNVLGADRLRRTQRRTAVREVRVVEAASGSRLHQAAARCGI